MVRLPETGWQCFHSCQGDELERPLPHPVEHHRSQFDPILSIPTDLGFLENKPGRFDGMPRIQGATMEVIEPLAVHSDRLHDALDIVVNKIPGNLGDADTLVQAWRLMQGR